MDGGMGKSLVDGFWNHGSRPVDIRRNIAKGIKYLGMPEFGKVLDDGDLDRLVRLIRWSEARKMSPATEE